MPRTVTVSLADLEGIPHGANAGTSVTIEAAYTSEVVLLDGTIIPTAIKQKGLLSTGLREFSITRPSERAEPYRNVGIKFTAKVQNGVGARKESRWERVVVMPSTGTDPIALGNLIPAEPVPAQWVSVEGFATDMTAAKAAAQTAAAAAETAATRAESAEAAKLEVPDANVSALVGNPATQTAAALVGNVSSRHGRSILDYPRQSGETHDMPRFKRALDAIAAAGGGRLVVPWIADGYEFRFTPGSTILNPTRLLIRTNNVDIVGIGQPLIRMTGLTTEYLFSIDDYASSGRDIFTAFSFAGVKDCSITGIDFAGEYTVDTIFRYQSPRAIAVAFKGATNCRAQSIGGRNIHGNLINVTNSSGTYDAPFAFASKVNISNVFAEHCLENGVNYMGGTNDCTADTLTANDCANGLETACDGFTANGLIFSANKGSGLGLSGKRMVINGLIATGNVRNVTGTPDPNFGYGIVITGGEDIQINAPKLNDNYAHAVFIYPGVKKVQITNPEARRNATNATNKTVFQMVGTSTARIQDVTITGGIIEAEGAVTGSIVNFADRVRVIGMHGTFDTAGSAFTFSADANNSRASGNRFNKVITMNDPTGEEFDNGLYRRIDRASAPSTGTWILGDVINNRSRSQGSVAEWNCIQSGTFGTLNGGNTTVTVAAGSTAATVSSATGLYVGAFLTITGLSGVRRVAAISGTNLTLDIAAEVAVTGGAVAYRQPVVIVSRQNGPKTAVTAAPDFAGQFAVVGGNAYMATGTTAASDWKLLS